MATAAKDRPPSPRIVRLSALDNLDCEDVQELFRRVKFQNASKGVCARDRLWGLVSCGHLRLFWKEKKYLHHNVRLQAAWDYAEGKIDYKELERVFDPQKVYGVKEVWATEWMKWNAISDGQKRKMLFEIVRVHQIQGVREYAETVYRANALWSLEPLLTVFAEAGYDNFAVLEHCRQEWHTHGCWLVDRILGKS